MPRAYGLELRIACASEWRIEDDADGDAAPPLTALHMYVRPRVCRGCESDRIRMPPFGYAAVGLTWITVLPNVPRNRPAQAEDRSVLASTACQRSGSRGG